MAGRPVAATEAVAMRPAAGPHPGNAELPRAASRTLGRHRRHQELRCLGGDLWPYCVTLKHDEEGLLPAHRLVAGVDLVREVHGSMKPAQVAQVESEGGLAGRISNSILSFKPVEGVSLRPHLIGA